MVDELRFLVSTRGRQEWQDKGACRELDTELFFNAWGERGETRRQRDRAAKRVCATCPVIQPCLAYALSLREPYGVWGGTTAEERETYLQKRGNSQTPTSDELSSTTPF